MKKPRKPSQYFFGNSTGWLVGDLVNLNLEGGPKTARRAIKFLQAYLKWIEKERKEK